MNYFMVYICRLLLPLVFLSGNSASDEQASWKEFKMTGFAQGTTYHITYYAKKESVTQSQVDSILKKIDSSMSVYKPYSIISRFNNSISGLRIDDHLKKVVLKSLDIFQKTNGISDITVYPLVNAWGFGPDRVSGYPDSAQIKALLGCVGAQKIHLENDSLIKDLPCVKIDVNGIAQGYSVDVVAGFMEKKNIGNYLVEIGGELRIKGRKQPGNTLLQIGIEAPAENSNEDQAIQKIIRLDHGALTTSGNFNKYHRSGGKTFSHLIDPKTGYSFQNELISVTVLAGDAITADGYDNALMGMGLKQAFGFMETHKDMEAYFIYRTAGGAIADTATQGFYQFLK